MVMPSCRRWPPAPDGPDKNGARHVVGGTVKRLLETKLIEESDERPDPQLDDERRRYYQLTGLGEQVALIRWPGRYCCNIVAFAREKGEIQSARRRHCIAGGCPCSRNPTKSDHFRLLCQDLQVLFAGVSAFMHRERNTVRPLRGSCFTTSVERLWNESRKWGLLKLWARVLPD